MTLRPLGNRLLVRVDDVPDTSSGGIFIPKTVNQDKNVAVVVSLGEGIHPEDVLQRVQDWRSDS